ncbi:hypothetical protein ESCO_005859 [Escovopsis weberi]|uniref:Uncharacterized protein n=1 Tax=Escovopsis weberi TaxID=150374 RepID=A0A0M9VRV7_ESCWE|nr:hypothetical protein ESCO_005859 [Escovopsis weberi]
MAFIYDCMRSDNPSRGASPDSTESRDHSVMDNAAAVRGTPSDVSMTPTESAGSPSHMSMTPTGDPAGIMDLLRILVQNTTHLDGKLSNKMDSLAAQARSQDETNKERLGEMHALNEHLRGQVDSLTAEAQSSRDTIRMLEGKIQGMAALNERLGAKMDDLKAESRQSRDAIDDLRGRVSDLTRLNQSLSDKMDGLHAEAQEAKAAVGRLEGALGSVLEGTASTTDMLCNRIDRVEDQIGKVQELGRVSQAAEARGRHGHDERLDGLRAMLLDADTAGKHHSAVSTTTHGILSRIEAQQLAERVGLAVQIQQVHEALDKGFVAGEHGWAGVEQSIARRVDLVEARMYELDPREAFFARLDRMEYRLGRVGRRMVSRKSLVRNLVILWRKARKAIAQAEQQQRLIMTRLNAL